MDKLKTWFKNFIETLGILAVLTPLLWAVHDQWYLPGLMTKIKENTRGGLGSSITTNYKIITGEELDKDDAARDIAVMLVWGDSLPAFQQTYIPMLLEEKQTIDVGVKYNKGKLYYLDTLGKRRDVRYQTDSTGRVWPYYRGEDDKKNFFLY